MIKKINIEEIKKREEFLYGKLLTRKEVEYALEEAKASVKRNMEYLNGKFPFSAAYNSEPFPSERDGMYPITENVEWTTGFWTGLIWLMYDWSREECFKELGMADIKSKPTGFDKRPVSFGSERNYRIWESLVISMVVSSRQEDFIPQKMSSLFKYCPFRSSCTKVISYF